MMPFGEKEREREGASERARERERDGEREREREGDRERERFFSPVPYTPHGGHIRR